MLIGRFSHDDKPSVFEIHNGLVKSNSGHILSCLNGKFLNQTRQLQYYMLTYLPYLCPTYFQFLLEIDFVTRNSEKKLNTYFVSDSEYKDLDDQREILIWCRFLRHP